MLTAKIGEKYIDCFSMGYTKEQLKNWSKKGIIVCPVCNKPYEYCHGRVATPYFRHKDKELCEDLYGEPETEEHIKGKKDLYKWLLTQEDVTDVVLEGWLPETKQRPDIMFKYKNEQYVFEYQCTPIATEFLERHDLYQAAGIKDIWICGIDKFLGQEDRKKTIMKYSIGHYNSTTKDLILYEYQTFYKEVVPRIKQSYGNRRLGYYIGRKLKNYRIVEDFKIKDMCFDELENIRRKREERRENIPIRPRKKDYYLNKQESKAIYKLIKLEEDLEDKLDKLSNKNWTFRYYYTHSKYKTFTYIFAIPNIEDSDYVLKILFDKLSKIKLWEMSESDIENCCNDEYFLKKLLLPMMVKNKNILLSYDFGNKRYLETGGRK